MSTGLDRRLGALAEAVELAEGRLATDAVADARAVLARAGERLGLGVEATVVALAGPTGAGKSTLFNALSGGELVTAGRRRPTTATATAAIWGTVPDALLDWLEVPRRHRVGNGRLDGLVLLDLPDFDSVEVANRLEVERVVGLADLTVWVADPQKYADAALHERYLRELRAYREAMVVVLNQADLLAPEALDAARADLTRLLGADGLPGVPVHAVSARTGLGLDELQARLEARVAAREAALARLGADVDVVVGRLDGGCDGRAGRVGAGERERLARGLEAAAGVPTVVRAVDLAHRRRGALATGWPLVRWVRRLRPDPLKRLRLPDSPEELTRASLPAPTPVQRAQVSAATRALAASAAGDLPDPWPSRLRTVATQSEEGLTERLQDAVARTDLRMTTPLWWTAAGALQAALAALVAVGVLWLLVIAGLGFAQLGDVVPVPDVEGIPLPTALLAGGALAGLLLAFLARIAVGVGARRRARRAQRRLRREVEGVGTTLVVDPVGEELEAHGKLCAALGQARGKGRR